MRFTLVSMVAVSMAGQVLQQSVPGQSSVNTVSSPASFEIVHEFTDMGLVRERVLTEASDGSIYGTTSAGGPPGGGAVFKITGAGKLTILHSFRDPAPDGREGFRPSGPLTETPDGQFVGMTYAGGTNGKGTIFRMTAQGVVTTLHSFSGDDGALPRGPLLPAADGSYFGLTASGLQGGGTIFRFTADEHVRTVRAFRGGSDGSAAHLVLGRDGNLYATTMEGGTDLGGSIIRITPAGVVTSLHDFTGGLDGAHPLGPLLHARDDYFYGTTAGGPTGKDLDSQLRGAPVPLNPNRISAPSVFKMTADGKITTLCPLPGTIEDGALVESPDGAFYGTVAFGPSFERGAAFKLTKDCTFTVLHSFSRRPVEGLPYSGLLRARDGRLWGTTTVTHRDRGGTVYRIVP